MDVCNVLDWFCEEHVKVPQEKLDEAYSVSGFIVDLLNENDVQRFDICQSGSSARSTCVRPLHDIDQLVVVKDEKEFLSPKFTVLGLFDLLRNKYSPASPGNKNELVIDAYDVTTKKYREVFVRKQGVSVGFCFGDRWTESEDSCTYDLVPVYEYPEGKNEGEMLIKRGSVPVHTCPNYLKELEADLDEKFEGKFTQSVRLLKYWNGEVGRKNNGKGSPFKSLFIEFSILHHFRKNEKDFTSKSIVELLYESFKALRSATSYGATMGVLKGRKVFDAATPYFPCSYEHYDKSQLLEICNQAFYASSLLTFLTEETALKIQLSNLYDAGKLFPGESLAVPDLPKEQLFYSGFIPLSALTDPATKDYSNTFRQLMKSAEKLNMDTEMMKKLAEASLIVIPSSYEKALLEEQLKLVSPSKKVVESQVGSEELKELLVEAVKAGDAGRLHTLLELSKKRQISLDFSMDDPSQQTGHPTMLHHVFQNLVSYDSEIPKLLLHYGANPYIQETYVKTIAWVSLHVNFSSMELREMYYRKLSSARLNHLKHKLLVRIDCYLEASQNDSAILTPAGVSNVDEVKVYSVIPDKMKTSFYQPDRGYKNFILWNQKISKFVKKKWNQLEMEMNKDDYISQEERAERHTGILLSGRGPNAAFIYAGFAMQSIPNVDIVHWDQFTDAWTYWPQPFDTSEIFQEKDSKYLTEEKFPVDNQIEKKTLLLMFLWRGQRYDAGMLESIKHKLDISHVLVVNKAQDAPDNIVPEMLTQLHIEFSDILQRHYADYENLVIASALPTCVSFWLGNVLKSQHHNVKAIVENVQKKYQPAWFGPSYEHLAKEFVQTSYLKYLTNTLLDVVNSMMNNEHTKEESKEWAKTMQQYLRQNFNDTIEPAEFVAAPTEIQPPENDSAAREKRKRANSLEDGKQKDIGKDKQIKNDLPLKKQKKKEVR